MGIFVTPFAVTPFPKASEKKMDLFGIEILANHGVFAYYCSEALKKRCCKRGFAKKIGFDAVENPYRNSVACGTHSKRRYTILKKKYSILEPTFTNEHSYAFLNDFSEVARNRGD